MGPAFVSVGDSILRLLVVLEIANGIDGLASIAKDELPCCEGEKAAFDLPFFGGGSAAPKEFVPK